VIDDDWIDDDDYDVPLDVAARTGALVVPGVCINSAVLEATGIGFKAERPVIFVRIDEDTGEEILENLDELQEFGFKGSTIELAERWLNPRYEPPNAERDAAVIVARAGK